MASHRTVTLPPSGFLRALRLSSVARDGAIVYELPDGSHVESRASWPDGTTGLAETHADPAALGWARLTPG